MMTKLCRDFVATVLAYSVNRDIQLFSNGFDALNSLETSQGADIILSDVYIPELDGFDLLAAIKKKFPHKTCILMSSIPKDEETARRLGRRCFYRQTVLRQRPLSDCPKIRCPRMRTPHRHRRYPEN